MGLNQRLKEDTKQITSNTDEWGVEVVFTAPDGEQAEVACLFTAHHLTINEMGVANDSANASICVSEELLIEQYYPTRNSDDQVHFEAHRVYAESKNYICERWQHDASAGVIILHLGLYNG